MRLRVGNLGRFSTISLSGAQRGFGVLGFRVWGLGALDPYEHCLELGIRIKQDLGCRV